MDKVAQRVKKAEQHVLRHVRRRQDTIKYGEQWQRKRQWQHYKQVQSTNIKEQRANRKLDWQAGPLAPRRDVGEKLKTYGTVSYYDMSPPVLEERDQKWSGIAKGDRVVVTHGQDKGKIGYVYKADDEEGRVVVKDINMVDIFVPEYARKQAGQTQEILPNPHWMMSDHVKLVYPLPDPETGVPRDVVIDRLEKIKVSPQDDPYGEDLEDEHRREARVIPGTNTIIPWPQLPKESDEEEFDDDTPRITVDEVSFQPYLLYPPMPNTVIDELRHKFSKFRTRHTLEYEQKKEAEVAREERRQQLGKTMRTPLQELAEMRARQKAAEQKQLSDEQLAKIGEMMARGRTGRPTLEQ